MYCDGSITNMLDHNVFSNDFPLPLRQVKSVLSRTQSPTCEWPKGVSTFVNHNRHKL